MLSILGLADSYVNDGRVITQILDDQSLSRGLDDRVATQLGDAYKQVNAPFGAFGHDTLIASTAALKSADELTYDTIESKIANLTFRRDALAGTIRSALDAAEFGNSRIDEDQARDWIQQAQHLLDEAHTLATSS
jgi:hypothetical protein